MNLKEAGVGLSICKKIIENHDGFIIAESKINEGSTFTLVLPEKTVKLLHLKLKR
jgi:signal transduction histidine kinase